MAFSSDSEGSTAHFRRWKAHFRQELASPDWAQVLDTVATAPPKEVASPLIACLPLGEPITDRAALALGAVVARMEQESPEEAKNILRRLMWHMNEESGNIGWGIPQAFAAILVASRSLAQTFSPILLSYIIHTGKDDNFCDHDILRRSCYQAVIHLALAWPEFADRATKALTAGLEDPDSVCRSVVQEGLERLTKKAD